VIAFFFCFAAITAAVNDEGFWIDGLHFSWGSDASFSERELSGKEGNV
jgi:hypothetical protein